MIKIMSDLPDNVLGVAAVGHVTAADYEQVLIPAVEEKLKNNLRIRLLYVLGENFNNFDLGAMFDDAKLGLGHLSQWERIALVSDHHVINTISRFFGYMLSGHLHVYKLSQLEDAKKWVTAADSVPVHDDKSWLMSALGKINTEFPLSGGETNADLARALEHEQHDPTTKREHMNTNFPLSGGDPE